MPNPWKLLKNLFSPDKSKPTSPKTTEPSKTPTELTGVLKKWSNFYSEDSESSSDEVVALLQKQITCYESQIEKRRQMLIEQSRSSVFAVTGNRKPLIKDTDDALPYKPILLDLNKALADLRAKREAQEKAKGSLFKKLFTSSPKQKGGKTGKQQTTTTPSKASSSPSSEEEDADEVGRSPRSTSSSTSEGDQEKLHGLSAILMSMIEEVESKIGTRDWKEPAMLSGQDLVNISKNEPNKFDYLVLNNVKNSLFRCQPTKEEISLWNNKTSRKTNPRRDELKWNLENPIQIKAFCVSCQPRRYQLLRR